MTKASLRRFLCKLCHSVNERELSRRLSTGVVETLKAQGHILVVKGGAVFGGVELKN